MRVALHSPPLRGLAQRCAPPRLGLEEVAGELRYQLSNADPESRPARDLIESGPATAYLVVLALFAAGLAWLALADSRAKAKREEGMAEIEAAAERMRADGYAEEAAVLDSELKDMRRKPKPKKEEGAAWGDPRLRVLGSAFQPKVGDAAAGFDDDEGSRFERRQKKKKEKGKPKRKGKRRSRG